MEKERKTINDLKAKQYEIKSRLIKENHSLNAYEQMKEKFLALEDIDPEYANSNLKLKKKKKDKSINQTYNEDEL